MNKKGKEMYSYLRVLLLIFSIILLTIGCTKQEKIERFMEDGVEVIVNHIEPYKIKGEPSTFHLEKELVIDSEKDEIAKLGLTDIGAFDVDSKGNIYMVNPKGRENMIFKFDRNGNFVHSFCRIGQGPGEMEFPTWVLYITSQDEITFMNAQKKKLLLFNTSGNLIEETLINIRATVIFFAAPLQNGNYLCIKFVRDTSSDYLHSTLGIYGPTFKEINVLDEFNQSNYYKGLKRQGVITQCESITKDKIFVGNDNRGYEIWVFDLDGNLMRKIRKEYKKIPIPNEFIKKRLEAMNERWRKMTIFPKYFPPFQGFFIDNKGRLYVMTYEKGEDSNEYIIDIFNAEGIFIGRKSLKVFFDLDEGFLWATVKLNRLYCKNEKESGFKELVVYKMRWE